MTEAAAEASELASVSGARTGDALAGVSFLFRGGVGLGGAGGRTDRLAQPTGQNEPPPDQRLPPREARTELRGTTGRTPELHGQTDAMEIERSDPTLKPLPTNADQELPTPSGPATL